jgi:methylenetetrahydrofolate reductase (NADPH)
MKTFRKALQGPGFPMTAEFAFPVWTSLDEMLRHSETLAESVDAIQLGEYSDSWNGIAAPALASLLLKRGIDAVPRLGCRDRNRIALQSDLLGLRTLGVSSLILSRGSHAQPGNIPGARPVFDLRCRELVAMAHAMNEEEWSDGDHEFVIGTQVTAVERSTGWNTEWLTARASAGARFLQTRPCADLDLLRNFMQGLVEEKLTWGYSVIVTLSPDPNLEGIDACARLMRETSQIPGVSGINLIISGHPEAVVEAIQASGLKSG